MTRSRWFASSGWLGAFLTSSQAESSSVPRSRERLSVGPACCCSTSRSRALTRNSGQTLRSELARLQRALRLTTVYVTHDREDAAVLADRIVEMRAGGIIAVHGNPDERRNAREARAPVAWYCSSASCRPRPRSPRPAASCARPRSRWNRPSRSRTCSVLPARSLMAGDSRTPRDRVRGDSLASRADTRVLARIHGRSNRPALRRESTPELELESNFVWLPALRTRGWISSHVDVVDKFSAAERPGDSRAYTHKLNFELDTSVRLFNWLPAERWLRGVELEGSLDYVATGLPQRGDIIDGRRYLDDASPWSFSLVLVLPVAPF